MRGRRRRSKSRIRGRVPPQAVVARELFAVRVPTTSSRPLPNHFHVCREPGELNPNNGTEEGAGRQGRPLSAASPHTMAPQGHRQPPPAPAGPASLLGGKETRGCPQGPRDTHSIPQHPAACRCCTRSSPRAGTEEPGGSPRLNPSFRGLECCLLAGRAAGIPTDEFISRIFAGGQEETGWGWNGLNRS